MSAHTTPADGTAADDAAAASEPVAEPLDAQPLDAEPLDTKARFRAALERKRLRETSGGSGMSGDAKITGAHSAAGGRRVFRRKSG